MKAQSISYYKVDISPEKMKQVRKMFRYADLVSLPISGAEMLKRVREHDRIVPLETLENKSLKMIVMRRFLRIKEGMRLIFT